MRRSEKEPKEFRRREELQEYNEVKEGDVERDEGRWKKENEA